MDVAGERAIVLGAIMQACLTNRSWRTTSRDVRQRLMDGIESSCYAAAAKYADERKIPALFSYMPFRECYSAITSKIIAHLDVNSVVYADCPRTNGAPVGAGDIVPLFDRLLTGDVAVANVANLSALELWPPASAAERDEIARRQSVSFEPKCSLAHTCVKCKSNRTQILSNQTRASDEDNTHSYKCMGCGHRWRR